MFEEENIPNRGDAVDRMKQWIWSVENSIARAKRMEVRSNRRMTEFVVERPQRAGITGTREGPEEEEPRGEECEEQGVRERERDLMQRTAPE